MLISRNLELIEREFSNLIEEHKDEMTGFSKELRVMTGFTSIKSGDCIPVSIFVIIVFFPNGKIRKTKRYTSNSAWQEYINAYSKAKGK